MPAEKVVFRLVGAPAPLNQEDFWIFTLQEAIFMPKSMNWDPGRCYRAGPSTT
jgi:hypothetical protein